MTRHETPATRFASWSAADRITGPPQVRGPLPTMLAAALAGVLAGSGVLTASSPAQAADVKASGRIMAGHIVRVQERDPHLMTGVNAAAIGLSGLGSGGNADDANTNYDKGDAVSRAVKAIVEVSAVEGGWSGMLRAKAWHDAGLHRDGRPWGNVANGYAAGAPLSDSGAPRRSRFSGVTLLDAWVQGRFMPAALPLTVRLGQQTLPWGERALTPGGLEALNPRDAPGLHRAAPVQAETVVPRPMLFARLEPAAGFGVEAFYQPGFRPSTLDVCGTLWSMSDYLVDGCDKVMSGQPIVSDRARLPLGAYQKRLPTRHPDAGEFGVGFSWRPQGTELEVGLYHARYHSRSALPSLRRSGRPDGPALIAGDPDGRNMAYFTEYPEGLRISALTISHKLDAAAVHGELSYRPGTPFMLAPGDVLQPFLSATAPALLRARADAVAPGGVFHGYDLYAMWQAQLGARRDWQWGGVKLTGVAEFVGKHARELPAASVVRYGRADIFGVGPVHGQCTVTTGDAARQCSLRGYATPNAWGYRLRLDARLPTLGPQLATSASLLFVHDVKGWSGDLLLGEGRRSMNLALRFEYRKRYLAELGYQPSWGGDYHQAADRDTASFALGLKF
ncbi:DUF1302 domain-containing protein [Massilia agri]|uniref:DUF1302 domain-containing protein n=1 Tax=Massilia agri TaxID=1886785 RepID=A0ABT2AQE5_9BURK|nr:DUF1302 domain-containing protein [Massilia agri]MCS0598351.1 DUF1302 domain-containing protein [Massilia agri]